MSISFHSSSLRPRSFSASNLAFYPAARPVSLTLLFPPPHVDLIGVSKEAWRYAEMVKRSPKRAAANSALRLETAIDRLITTCLKRAEKFALQYRKSEKPATAPAISTSTTARSLQTDKVRRSFQASLRIFSILSTSRCSPRTFLSPTTFTVCSIDISLIRSFGLLKCVTSRYLKGASFVSSRNM